MTRLKIILTIALLCTVAQGAWAQYSGGSGTEADPYKISTADDWNTLCTNVNNGTSTYSSKFFKLMADITVEESFSAPPTKMVGRSEDVNFRGTFDGNGHTLTVNYVDDNDEDFSAPFRYIRNATIKNLHVAGSITRAKKICIIVGTTKALAYSIHNMVVQKRNTRSVPPPCSTPSVAHAPTAAASTSAKVFTSTCPYLRTR